MRRHYSARPVVDGPMPSRSTHAFERHAADELELFAMKAKLDVIVSLTRGSDAAAAHHTDSSDDEDTPLFSTDARGRARAASDDAATLEGRTYVSWAGAKKAIMDEHRERLQGSARNPWHHLVKTLDSGKFLSRDMPGVVAYQINSTVAAYQVHGEDASGSSEDVQDNHNGNGNGNNNNVGLSQWMIVTRGADRCSTAMVSGKIFKRDYEPVLNCGRSDLYRLKKVSTVLAKKFSSAPVVKSKGRHQVGSPGDWLVQESNGVQSVCPAREFTLRYERIVVEPTVVPAKVKRKISKGLSGRKKNANPTDTKPATRVTSFVFGKLFLSSRHKARNAAGNRNVEHDNESEHVANKARDQKSSGVTSLLMKLAGILRDFGSEGGNGKGLKQKNMEEAVVTNKPTSGIALLIIDPQRDFHRGGSLAVPGADEDAKRIAAFIDTHGRSITSIHVTLDSHSRKHISHPGYWVGGVNCANEKYRSSQPPPFTQIRRRDVLEDVWTPADRALKRYTLEYLERLEESGRLTHTVWPNHCLVDSAGHAIVDSVKHAIRRWEEASGQRCHEIRKGENDLAEMYSALRAEVPVEGDTSTDMNLDLVAQLQKSGRVVICGQALSHCVRWTMLDLLQAWPAERMADITLMSDGSSGIPGFGPQIDAFLAILSNKGVRVEPSTTIVEQTTNTTAKGDTHNVKVAAREDSGALESGGARQLAVRRRRDGLWEVRKPLLKPIKSVVQAEREAVCGRGVFNETILHDCFLFMSGTEWSSGDIPMDDKIMKALAKFFIQYCPFLINKVYEHPMYYGESALHLAVIKHELPLCSLLLARGADVNARTRGFFFLPHPQTKNLHNTDVPLWVKRAFADKAVHCYFGEYCLSFAVCTLQIDLARVLLEAGADPNAIDSLGNTPLHALVEAAIETFAAGTQDDDYFHRVDRMYNFLHRYHQPADTYILNNYGLTPLALAASVGCYVLFDNILECERTLLWKYGPVACHEYPLQLIDSFVDPLAKAHAATAEMLSGSGRHFASEEAFEEGDNSFCCGRRRDESLRHMVLHPQRVLTVVVERKQYELLEHPIIRHLLKDKWEAYGRSDFILKLYQVIVHLLLLMGAVVTRPHDRNLLRFEAPYSLIRVAFETCTVAFVLKRFGAELWALRNRGKDYFWLSPEENSMEWLYFTLILLAACCRGVDAIVVDPGPETDEISVGQVESMLVSSAVIIGWMFFFYITRVLFFLGPLVAMMVQIVSRDVSRFLVIWLLFTLAISQAVVVQFRGRQDQRVAESEELMFAGIVETIWELLQSMEGSRSRWRFADASTPMLTRFLFIIQFFFVAILLLNILIAMMNDTLQSVMAKAIQEWRLQRAEQILKAEALPRNQAKWRQFMLDDMLYKFNDQACVWTMLVQEKHGKYVEQQIPRHERTWQCMLACFALFTMFVIMVGEHVFIIEANQFSNTANAPGGLLSGSWE